MNLKPGNEVKYRNVNLWHLTGVVEDVRRMPHGGDCIIVWKATGQIPASRSEEWSGNLILKEQENE